MFDELDTKKSEEEQSTDWSGTIAGLLLIPVFLIFRHEGRTDIGLNLCVCLLGIFVGIKVCWSLRSHLWFWGVILLVLSLNIPLILIIEWPHRWVPGIALLPVALAEFALTVGALRMAERLFVKTAQGDEEK
jgi:hypothetical protein